MSKEERKAIRDSIRSQSKGLKVAMDIKRVEIECLKDEIIRLEALEYDIMAYLGEQDKKGGTHQ